MDWRLASRTFRDVDVAVAVGVDGVIEIASSAHVDRTEPRVACGTRDGIRGVQQVRSLWRDLPARSPSRRLAAGDEEESRRREGRAPTSMQRRYNRSIGTQTLTSGSEAKLARRGMPLTTGLKC